MQISLLLKFLTGRRNEKLMEQHTNRIGTKDQQWCLQGNSNAENKSHKERERVVEFISIQTKALQLRLTLTFL